MDASHTPAPWSVAELSSGHLWIENATIVKSVASVIAYPEQAANARLIAAAPDLFAACKAYFAGPEKDAQRYSDEEWAALNLMLRAIAKAEGR